MKGRVFLLSAVVITLIASLAYVRSRFLLVELSFDLSRKRELKARLEQEKRELTLELATLQRPGRIERIARHELKLTRPESATQVIDFRTEGQK